MYIWMVKPGKTETHLVGFSPIGHICCCHRFEALLRPVVSPRPGCIFPWSNLSGSPPGRFPESGSTSRGTWLVPARQAVGTTGRPTSRRPARLAWQVGRSISLTPQYQSLIVILAFAFSVCTIVDCSVVVLRSQGFQPFDLSQFNWAKRLLMTTLFPDRWIYSRHMCPQSIHCYRQKLIDWWKGDPYKLSIFIYNLHRSPYKILKQQSFSFSVTKAKCALAFYKQVVFLKGFTP